MALLIFIVMCCLFLSKDDYMGKICVVIVVWAVLWLETPFFGILWDVISAVFGFVADLF